MAEPTIAERLAEIREREQAATPGPWTPSLKYPHICWQGDDNGSHILSANLSERPAEDIAFSAHAREDVPALLDEVERLRCTGPIECGHEAALGQAQAEVERLNGVANDHLRDIAAVMLERDAYANLLDTFASAIAPIEVIGEHSFANDPWANALELVTPDAEVKRLTDDLAAARVDAEKWRRVEYTISRAADHGHDAYIELMELAAESSSPTEEKA